MLYLLLVFTPFNAAPRMYPHQKYYLLGILTECYTVTSTFGNLPFQVQVIAEHGFEIS